MSNFVKKSLTFTSQCNQFRHWTWHVPFFFLQTQSLHDRPRLSVTPVLMWSSRSKCGSQQHEVRTCTTSFGPVWPQWTTCAHTTLDNGVHALHPHWCCRSLRMRNKTILSIDLLTSKVCIVEVSSKQWCVMNKNVDDYVYQSSSPWIVHTCASVLRMGTSSKCDRIEHKRDFNHVSSDTISHWVPWLSSSHKRQTCISDVHPIYFCPQCLETLLQFAELPVPSHQNRSVNRPSLFSCVSEIDEKFCSVLGTVIMENFNWTYEKTRLRSLINVFILTLRLQYSGPGSRRVQVSYLPCQSPSKPKNSGMSRSALLQTSFEHVIFQKHTWPTSIVVVCPCGVSWGSLLL